MWRFRKVLSFLLFPIALLLWAAVPYDTLDAPEQICDIKREVLQVSKQLASEQIMYNSASFTDCSGMYHRLLHRLRQRCSGLPIPDRNHFRTTRDIARWFYNRGKLIRIKNAREMDAYIQVGTVMFYGPQGRPLNHPNIRSLFAENGINHVGVVTAVQKDSNGRVTGYSLFHGRRPGKPADITSYHRRDYTNRPDYPAYGNGTEHWVAIANLDIRRELIGAK